MLRLIPRHKKNSDVNVVSGLNIVLKEFKFGKKSFPI